MNRKSVLWIVLSVLTFLLVLVTPSLATSQNTQIAQRMMGGSMMHGGMHGQEMMGKGMMSGDMGTVHQLFARHNQIRRTVENIPGGIRSVTESDNPQVAALIQSHVASMYQRLEDGRELSMMSPTLPIMFRNADHYQRRLEKTPKGVVVTETSDNPDLVAIIREHAREVNDFVAEGMPAMMGGMMK